MSQMPFEALGMQQRTKQAKLYSLGFVLRLTLGRHLKLRESGRESSGKKSDKGTTLMCSSHGL